MGVDRDDPEVENWSVRDPGDRRRPRRRRPPDEPRLSDNVGGARLAVRHLHALGHRRIATIAGPQATKPGADRLLGYRAELRALGLEAVPGYE